MSILMILGALASFFVPVFIVSAWSNGKFNNGLVVNNFACVVLLFVLGHAIAESAQPALLLSCALMWCLGMIHGACSPRYRWLSWLR